MRAGVTSKHHVILVQIGDKIKKTSKFQRPLLALKIPLLKEIKNFRKALNKDKSEIIHFSLKYAKLCKLKDLYEMNKTNESRSWRKASTVVVENCNKTVFEEGITNNKGI